MSREIKYKSIEVGAGAILLAYSLFALHYLTFTENEMLIWYLAAYVFLAVDVYITVVRNVRKLKIFDEHFLIVLATVGAFLAGEYAEADAVMLFFQIGKLLEIISLERSKRSIAKFMDIKPEYANRKVRGREFVIDPKLLKIGHIIVIKPGERIPVDAVVTEGTSTVDTKALTGESMPREVKTGDILYSGSINMSGLLEARVSREYQDSTVAKILDLVEQANDKKGEHETFVSRFTKVYTPLVTLLAFAVMIIPSVTFAPDDLHTWVYRGLIFLVTAIPSGLMISVPLAFFGGIGSAARQGILIKGCNFLEDLTKVDTFVFDKTGTLTEGTFAVAEIHPRKMAEEKLLEMMAYAEAYSTHPIALSLRNAYGKEIDKRKIKWVREFSGYGVKASIEGREILVGNAKFICQNEIFCQRPEHPGTAVHLAIDGMYEGYALITDVLREDTADMIRALRKNHKTLVMLTGDNDRVARSIGKQLHMDYVYANLLPEEKVEQLEEFLESEMGDDKLAFVGDGLNDAPVLARADIGIAMGGLGSDAAIEAADIVLMEDEPYRIIVALGIAKETVKVVRQNMYFAIGMKVILLALAAVGYITMKNAILADMAVLILNLLNSYWVLKYSD